MKWHRELILCLFIGIITLILFAFTGHFYFANEHSILTNTIVWLVLNFIAYSSVIFFPFFQKKRVKYVDLWAFASGLLATMLYCLSRAKSIDEYSYLSVLSYISGILSIFELFLHSQRKVEKSLMQGKTEQKYIDLMSELPLDLQHDIIKLILTYEKMPFFKFSDAVNTLKKNEYRTRRIIKSAIACSIIAEEGNTSAKKYHIIRSDSIVCINDMKNGTEEAE